MKEDYLFCMNCDKRPEATHSSFNESLATLWGLIQYQRATGDGDVAKAVKCFRGFLHTSPLPFRNDRGVDQTRVA
jgi:hypothetical protein